MKETLTYIDISGEQLLLHVHAPSFSNGTGILFLDPVLDEKKRVQRFQAEMSRKLCGKGFHSFRFDHYGTGDSSGELHQFEFLRTVEDIGRVKNLLIESYGLREIILFGIRMGADLAVIYANKDSTIKKLVLIEPIIHGKRYLLEQRVRRQAFFKLNRMPDVSEVFIDTKKFEDFQGYPLSDSNLAFLEDHDLLRYQLRDREIFLFKLAVIFSKKPVVKFKEGLTAVNILSYFESSTSEFWASLEYLDTTDLSLQILKMGEQIQNSLSC